MEMDLRENDNNIRELAESLPQIVFELDMQANITYVNRYGFKSTGYLQENIENGLNILQLIIPEDHERMTHDTAKIFSGKNINSTEYTIQRKDGHALAGLFYLRPIIRGDKIKGIRGFIVDITVQKQREKEIKQFFQTQSVLNKLLSLSLQDLALPNILDQLILLITSLPSLGLETSGAVFLKEDEPNLLIMKSRNGLPGSLPCSCVRVPFGKCLCGRAALSREVVFADHVGKRHENQCGIIYPHGHYCVPILSTDGEILGVYTVLIKEHCRRNRMVEETLIAVANVVAGIIKRKRVEETLQKAKDELEKQVEERTAELARKNIALKEVLGQLELEKEQIANRVVSNVDKLLLPVLRKIKNRGTLFERRYIELMENNLKQLTSSFGVKISKRDYNLTSREIEICSLIKEGLTTKEIAEILHLSPGTIEVHRYNIRKKLGISSTKINLSARLRNF